MLSLFNKLTNLLTSRSLPSYQTSNLNNINFCEGISPLRGENYPLVGLIAGNGKFPFEFIRGATENGYRVAAVCHYHETDPAIDGIVDSSKWIKLGELGKVIETFKSKGVNRVAMAGGISRVKWFGGVKLDTRGAKLLARLKSAKDDILMRGIADELESEGIKVFSCAEFMEENIIKKGFLTTDTLTEEEKVDIEVGRDAIHSMTGLHIGQVVVVREGVIVAVEAVEGTDAAISRGGQLGGKGTVVVKCAKPDQDMRFDIPTIGEKTIESMVAAKARVLAVEEGRSLIIDRKRVVQLAERAGICVVGVDAIVA